MGSEQLKVIQRKLLIKPVIILGRDEDGRYQAPYPTSLLDFRRKVYVSMKLLQWVTRGLLEIAGFKERCYEVEFEEDDGLPAIMKSEYSKSELQSLDDQLLWKKLAQEAYENYIRISEHDLKVIGFLTCSEYCKVMQHEQIPKNHSEIVSRIKAYVMCGIGGFALIGSACLYTWASSFEQIQAALICAKKVDQMMFQDDSNSRGTWGACYSTTLGSVLHELFHLLDLIHAGDGIMARGFVDLDKFVLPKLPEFLEQVNLVRHSYKPHKLFGYVDCSETGLEVAKTYENKQEVFGALNDDVHHRGHGSLAKSYKATAQEDMSKSAVNKQNNTSQFCDKSYENRDLLVQGQKSSVETVRQTESQFFLDRPSLVTLAFHKFLNRYPLNLFQIRRVGSSLTSEAGLRLICLRHEDRTVKHWEFLGDSPPKRFTVPTVLVSPTLTVFAVDALGNTLSTEWNV